MAACGDNEGSMAAVLAAGLHAGRFGLRDAIAGVPASAVIRVECPTEALANVNRPSDLAGHTGPSG